MTEAELREAIKTGLTGGYLLYGDEDYLKRFYLTKMRETVLSACPGLEPFNHFKLTLEDMDFGALKEALAAPPVMAEQKFVEVMPPNADKWRAEDREALEAVLSELSSYPDTVLVMVCPRDTLDPGTKNKPSATITMLKKYLTPVEIPFQTGAKLRRWVFRHFEEEGMTLTDPVCTAILNRCAPDLITLAQEIDKLICYGKAKGQTTVSLADVEFATAYTPKEDEFGLANALLSGDRTAALFALDIMKKRKDDPIMILAFLSKALCDLLTVARLVEDGAEKADIAKRFRWHEYKAGLYIRTARSAGADRIEATLEQCMAADRLSKSSQLGYIPLERFICTIPMGKGGDTLG